MSIEAMDQRRWHEGSNSEMNGESIHDDVSDIEPEKEKSPLDNAQASSLPMGVQDIFATGEESDANRLVDDTSVTTPPVSGAEMMQKAVDSILLFSCSSYFSSLASPRTDLNTQFELKRKSSKKQ